MPPRPLAAPIVVAADSFARGATTTTCAASTASNTPPSACSRIVSAPELDERLGLAVPEARADARGDDDDGDGRHVGLDTRVALLDRR